MKIIIDIPEEFESHFERDRFHESLCRLRTDAHCVAGEYEREVGYMLIEAFNNSTQLPKGHGDLKDADKLKTSFIKWSRAVQGNFTDADIASIVCSSPTIIEADTTRDCKTCRYSNGGKCAYTEECHECMFENKYIKADKEDEHESSS